MTKSTRTKHQHRIDEFMAKAGQAVPANPIVPSEGVRRLRAKLILEEALETILALGFVPTIPVMDPTPKDGAPIHISDVSFRATKDPDLTEIADGCADISVVTIGTLSACGISDKPLLKEVDESNLRKFGAGGHRREDGKWIKPKDWEPPNIIRVLQEQMKDDSTNP